LRASEATVSWTNESAFRINTNSIFVFVSAGRLLLVIHYWNKLHFHVLHSQATFMETETTVALHTLEDIFIIDSVIRTYGTSVLSFLTIITNE